MKKGVQGMFQGVIDTLHQKVFWKIQGFNLFMVAKRIVFYIFVALWLICVVSILSQIFHLSGFQKEKIASAFYFFTVIGAVFNMFKSSFRGTKSEGMLELLKAILNSMLWTLMFYLAFSINLTSYEKISKLILSWLFVSFLFELNKIIVFRKLSKKVESGKKTDYFDLIEQQVTKKFENERLSDAVVSETYKLKYSRISFKVNRRTIVENRIINLEEKD